MMQFEIINPSDPYTMQAPDLKIAAVVVVLLGQGKYALKCTDGRSEGVPLFLFGGHDKWFINQFGTNLSDTIDKVIEERAEELALAFDSVTLGRDERSSMNDIGGRAQQYAKNVRAKAAA
jgi:hypothetical protein